VETHDGDGVLLRETLRYAHGEAHVRRAMAAAGLTPVSLDFASTRTEKGEPVAGLIVVAKR
jgi:predicted TPR repeat methyltransferase